MEYGNDFDFSYGVPDGPTMSSSGSDIFSVIMTVYLLVIVAAVIIGIVKYVFKSIALYRLAQRTGNANPWMAWVPFARSYLQGDLAGSMPLKKRRLQSPGLWKVLIPLIGTAVIAGLYFLFIVVAGVGTALSYSTGMGAGSLTLIWVIVFLLIIAVVALQAIEAVLDVLVNFHIYHRLTSHNMAIIHSVLGIFIPMYEAICLFIMSKKPYNPGMEPNLPPQAPNFGGRNSGRICISDASRSTGTAGPGNSDRVIGTESVCESDAGSGNRKPGKRCTEYRSRTDRK